MARSGERVFSEPVTSGYSFVSPGDRDPLGALIVESPVDVDVTFVSPGDRGPAGPQGPPGSPGLTEAEFPGKVRQVAEIPQMNIAGLLVDLANKEPLAPMGTTSQYRRGDKTWATLNKAAVGLPNVDNTADADKPVSTPQANALKYKADLVGGFIPQNQIPAVALTDYLGEVNSQAEMLTLTGQRGDWCDRKDLGTEWQLISEPSTVLSSWREKIYPASPVQKVAGRTGLVVLATADITDTTTVGKALMKAADAATARTAIAAYGATDVANSQLVNLRIASGAFTFSLPDRNSLIEVTSAGPVAATIPTNASVAFPVGTLIEVTQAGAGAVTITPASGVTLTGPVSATTSSQWATLKIRKRAADVWTLVAVAPLTTAPATPAISWIDTFTGRATGDPLGANYQVYTRYASTEQPLVSATPEVYRNGAPAASDWGDGAMRVTDLKSLAQRVEVNISTLTGDNPSALPLNGTPPVSAILRGPGWKPPSNVVWTANANAYARGPHALFCGLKNGQWYVGFLALGSLTTFSTSSDVTWFGYVVFRGQASFTGSGLLVAEITADDYVSLSYKGSTLLSPSYVSDAPKGTFVGFSPGGKDNRIARVAGSNTPGVVIT